MMQVNAQLLSQAIKRAIIQMETVLPTRIHVDDSGCNHIYNGFETHLKGKYPGNELVNYCLFGTDLHWKGLHVG